jgi:phage I-like protein
MPNASSKFSFSLALAVANPNASWVKLLPLGEVIQYGDRRIELSEEYLTRLVSETRRLNAYFDQKALAGGGEAYRQPIWREHQRTTERDGAVEDVKLTAAAGFNGVWAKLNRTDDAQAAINASKVKYVSAGIVPEYTVESGEKFGPVIREVSLTADPMLKGIGSIQDTTEIQLSQNSGAQTMNLQDLLNRINDLAADVKAAIENQDEPEKEEPEAPKDPSPTPEANAPKTEPEPEEEPEAPKEPATVSLDVDTSEAEANLSKLSGIVDGLNAGLDKLAGREAEIVRLSKLNLSESGHQGGAEPAELNLSYSEKIEKIMKREKCSRLEAIEMEMNR